MSLNRRQVLLGGLGMGAAAGLSGCAGLTSKKGGGSDPAPSASGAAGKTTLTFVNWSGDEEKKAFDAVIAAFTKENPDITVKTDTVPYANIQTNLDSRFQASNPPDLFRVSYIDIGQYTSQGVLLDVSGQFDQTKVDTFVPGLWQGVVYDGKPYGVPHQIDTTAILYRKDAFEAAGITNVPTTLEEAWTWEEFADRQRQAAQGREEPADAVHLRLAGARRLPLAHLALRGRRQPARPRPQVAGDRLRRRPQGGGVHLELLHQGVGRQEHLGEERHLSRQRVHLRLGRDGVRRQLPDPGHQHATSRPSSSTPRCPSPATWPRRRTWAATRSWRRRTARTPRPRPSSWSSASARTR